jgi:hypothetical protein
MTGYYENLITFGQRKNKPNFVSLRYCLGLAYDVPDRLYYLLLIIILLYWFSKCKVCALEKLII